MRIWCETTRNRAFLAAVVILSGFAGAAPAAAQGVRLEPVDEAARNPAFATYRAALLDAMSRRDVDFVVAQADPQVKLSFGGAHGRAMFRQSLTGANDWEGEPYWRELRVVLELGGVFMEDGAFCTPYLACIDVPDCPTCDPFETVYVTRAGAVARASPDGNAAAVAKLSWDVLPLNYEAAGAEGWYAVTLSDGRTAYLSNQDSRMAIDYRARFEKTAAGWRMTVFLAGD